MKIAVTGGSGHVGLNLVRKLTELGYDVRVLVHKNIKNFDGIPVEKFKGDLLDIKSLVQFCKDVDVIFHLAAIISIGSDSVDTIYSTNVEGTKNLLKAIKETNVNRLIHFSSIHALINEPLYLPMDESHDLAINSNIAYEKTKAISETLVFKYQSEKLDVIVLNPTSIIGPADHTPSLMGNFICMLYKGNIPGVVPGGYDWVDVRDIVDASIAAIEKGKGGNRYILSGKWQSVKHFSDLFISISDKTSSIIVLPFWLARIGIPFMHIFAWLTNTKPIYTKDSLDILQSGNRQISSNKAKADLGFNPRPLKNTLRDTYLWFKENKYI